MAQGTSNELTIRVQAKGGMFLGPDSFNGAIITITDPGSGWKSTGSTNQGDSGARLPSYVPAATQNPIITPGTPYTLQAVNWVVGSPKTVCYTALVPLERPTLLEVHARIPLPVEQTSPSVMANLWFVPGQPLAAEPGMVLEVPGLWVQPELSVDGGTVYLKAKVTMMCGCEINSDLPWIPSDLNVVASILPVGCTPPITLDFDVNSQFVGQVSSLQPGDYVVEVVAYQISTGNPGVAKSPFRITGA